MVNTPTLPPGYAVLEPLSAQEHLGWGLLPDRGCYPHAQGMSAVPLAVTEFAAAMWEYPIVFSGQGEAAVPIAMTAIAVGDNVFVDAQGQWQAGCHVPGLLRRWPFWMSVEQGEAFFWMDTTSSRLVRLVDDADALPLFDYLGNPNEALSQVLLQMQQAARDEHATQAFMQALSAHGLLKPGKLELPLPGYSSYQLDGFYVLDEARFNALPDAVLVQWLRNGWASLLGLHLQSMQRNWGRLQHMHFQRHAAAVARQKSDWAPSAEKGAQ